MYVSYTKFSINLAGHSEVVNIDRTKVTIPKDCVSVGRLRRGYQVPNPVMDLNTDVYTKPFQ